MTLTPEQLAMRRNYIGASEAAAVLGISPFQKPIDVYWRKVLDTEPEPPTKAMTLGHVLEPAIISYAASELGVTVKPSPGTLTHPKGLPLCATPDALIDGKPEGIQAKTTRHTADWGEVGTDAIPPHYIMQVQQEMAIAGLQRMWVPVLMFDEWSTDILIYAVDRDDWLIEQIEHRLPDWWERHVVAKVPPGDTTPPLDMLKRLRREPVEMVPLDDDALAALEAHEQAKAKLKEAEQAEEAAKAKLLALLGTAEAGALPDGRVITYLSQRSSPKVDTSRLRAEWPEAYEVCVSQGTHRVLRVKKGK